MSLSAARTPDIACHANQVRPNLCALGPFVRITDTSTAGPVYDATRANTLGDRFCRVSPYRRLYRSPYERP